MLKTPILAKSSGAFLTTVLTSPGNYLLIPLEHVESLSELSDDWWRDVKQLLGQLPTFNDYNLSVNVGELAGQRVKHIHFWLIPRFAGQAASGKGFAQLIDEANAH